MLVFETAVLVYETLFLVDETKTTVKLFVIYIHKKGLSHNEETTLFLCVINSLQFS
jgi:hypothetical protein